MVRESRAVRKAVIEYIEKLEEKIKNPFNVPKTYKEALLSMAKQVEEMEQLKQHIAETRS